MKSLLNENESCRFTSLPGGCFFKILYFAQARDCRFRESSPSGMPVAVLISFADEEHVTLWICLIDGERVPHM